MSHGRVLSHQWTNKKPFTARVRWYAADLTPEGRHKNVRLVFEDKDGVANRHYSDDWAAALADWEAFKTGRSGTTRLRRLQAIAPSAPAPDRRTTVACYACGKPVRLEAANHRDDKYWHSTCPWPEKSK